MWAASDRRLLTPLVIALIALAWLVLWVWGSSPYGRFLSHHSLDEVRGGGLLALVFVAGWTVMIVAMMLPTSLPLIVLFHTFVGRRANGARLVALLIAGYLGIWTLFGVAVYVGDWGVHDLVEQNGWLRANAWAIGAAILVLAGLYQFTPLKYHCLDKCRSPLVFITERWQGGREGARAFGIGISHGIFCLGCCWSLMLLMFAVGIGNLGWMLALGTVMAVEKNISWGRRMSAPLGVVLVAWGAYLLRSGLM